MYIYTQDNGWRGSIIVIASTEEEALEKMKKYYNYDSENEIGKHEINKDFEWCDLGDC